MMAEQAVSQLENYTWSAARQGLDRTRELLQRLGNPQKELKFVHVAGSNGKGSTCAMLEAILRAAGYRTGLYTSPYLQDFCERMRVNGANISPERLAVLAEQGKQAAEDMEERPSQFELVTALAMVYFAQEECDIVVLETGMGGALDSTNVIDAPEVAVITNIGLEHTAYLGNTLAEIAATKGGIIKRGAECICCDSAAAVRDVIGRICKEKEVPCTFVEASEVCGIRQSLDGQSFLWRNTPYTIPLLGEYQLHNAAVALQGMAALRRKGWRISQDAVKQGLHTVRWPARMEILSRRPLFLLDGGHNPQCAQALTESLKTLCPGRKFVFLVGVMAEKNYGEMMETLIPYAESFLCVSPQSPRAMEATDLAVYLQKKGCQAAACEEISQGIAAALQAAGDNGGMVAFGSLYLAGAVRTEFGSVYRSYLRKQKIAYRNALSHQQREEYSRRIVERLRQLPAYKMAKNILLYRAIGGEVMLHELQDDGKCFAYPVCLSKTEMIACVPENDRAWHSGYCGIREPLREKSKELSPEQLDLVICPCTAFDEKGSRLGMGGGFYDRYLPQCNNAAVIAVAFEEQKVNSIPVEPWDIPMDAVVTEVGVYRR